jgi:heat shock protein HslJ
MKYFVVYFLLGLACSASAQTKKTFYVADRIIQCGAGFGLHDCLQVKEKKKDSWQGFFPKVEGFNYEEGYEYKITVSVTDAGKVRPDQSGLNYKLLKVVSKKKTTYNPAAKLEGRKWILISMHDNDHTIRLKDSTIYLELHVKDNRLSGHGVCNSMKGKLSADGKNISFSEIAFTKMLCLDQGNIFEKIVQNLLENSATWKKEENLLTFYSPKGSNMVFKEWVELP